MSDTQLTDELVERALEGWGLGGTDGTIICDGCGHREQLRRGEATALTGYATNEGGRSSRVHLLHVYCDSCIREEVTPPTPGVVEFIVSFDAVRDGRQASARDVSIMDRSEERDG